MCFDNLCICGSNGSQEAPEPAGCGVCGLEGPIRTTDIKNPNRFQLIWGCFWSGGMLIVNIKYHPKASHVIGQGREGVIIGSWCYAGRWEPMGVEREMVGHLPAPNLPRETWSL